jgi:hypothetical protein
VICRQCGTEIADKAIVCYRCGTATTAPVRRPAPVRRRRSPVLPTAALVLLVLAALFLGEAGRIAPQFQAAWEMPVAAILAGLAVVILIVRIARRRR